MKEPKDMVFGKDRTPVPRQYLLRIIDLQVKEIDRLTDIVRKLRFEKKEKNGTD